LMLHCIGEVLTCRQTVNFDSILIERHILNLGKT